MTLHKILKTFAILSYLLIFVTGDHVGGPMIILMFFAIFTTGFLTQLLILLIFLGLISLVLLTLFKKNYRTFLIEGIICILMTLPIIIELRPGQSRLLHYPMFIIPAICFLLLYILSLYFSYGAEQNSHQKS